MDKICEYDAAIKKDIKRTLPEFKILKSPEYQKRMYNILVAVANSIPDVGYIQGFNSIVGVYLVQGF